MNNYILSIDPSLKDTGFVLWEKYEDDSKCECFKKDCCEINCCNQQYSFKPIWVNNYNFNKFSYDDFIYKIISRFSNEYLGNNINININYLNIYIERGFNSPLNSRSRERMESLRGNIFGLFNKLYIPKEHGILPKVWQNWYLNKTKWDKNLSLITARYFIKKYNWNIDIKNNHNIADALLIGWYVINNEINI